ncbi:MAG TPA: hypothetical protein VH599_15400 [Ktedonobacterales bacterium]|jgi:hypothetical protein
MTEDEQKVIAQLILELLQAERRWNELFNDPRSEKALDEMVAEALAEDAAGLTRDLDELL